MRKLLLLLLLILATPLLAQAQGVLVTAGPYNKAGLLYVCPAPSGGTPCPTPSPIFADAGLTQPLSNPISTPAETKITFYIAAGQYTLEMPASGRQEVITVTSGSGLPGGSPPQTQVNDPGNPGHFGGTACETFPNLATGPANVNCDWHPVGANPYIDVTNPKFGVRACNASTTPCATGITASTSLGSANVTLSSASTFINGDGISLYGAGAPHSMTTPVAPTVTPSIARVLTGTKDVVNGPTGATTYNYQIFAEDKNGGLTAASTVGSTTTGAASLGSQTVNLTSCTRANDVVTCTTSSSHGLNLGSGPGFVQMVVIVGATDASFSGWWATTNVADNTHFSFNSANDTRNGASTTTTGGTMTWFSCNHLTWSAVTGAYRYWILGRTGGSLTTIGVSWPTNTTLGAANGSLGELAWDDFGSPMMDNFLLPPWIPSTPPASATSDHLTTTIVSGGGTTSLTLAANAGTTLASAKTVLDAVPGIKAAEAAANQTQGTFPIYFPNVSSGTYVINSFLDLTSFHTPTLLIPGGLQLNDTMQLPGASRVSGTTVSPTTLSSSSFSFESYPVVVVTAAYPGVHVINGGSGQIEGLSFKEIIAGPGTGNDAILMAVDGGSANAGFSLERVELLSGTGGDLMGTCLLARGDGQQIATTLRLHKVLLGPGQSGTAVSTGAPSLLCTSCTTVSFEHIFLEHRGIYLATPGQGFPMSVFVSWAYMQAGQDGTTPFLTTGQSSGGTAGTVSVTLENPIILDTMPHPLLANLGVGVKLRVSDFSIAGPSGSTTTSVPYSGVRPTSILGRSDFGNGNLGRGSRDTFGFTGSGSSVDGIFNVPIALGYSQADLGVGPAYSLFIDALPMAAPTGVVAAGGSVPVGVHPYQVAPLWINGGVGSLSPVTNVTTTTGNQTVNLSWTPVTGPCKGYVVYRDGAQLTNLPLPSVSPCSANSFSDTLAITNGASAPQQSSGGPTMLMPGSQGMVTPTIQVGAPGFNGVNASAGSVLSGANSVYDNFNRANGGLGSNWTTYASNCPNSCGDGPQVSGNQMVSDNTGGNHAAFYSASNLAADEFEEVTWTSATTATTNFQMLLRSVSGTQYINAYNCAVSGTAPTTFAVQFAQSSLNSTTGTLNVGDVLRCEVQGNTTITLKQNGAVVATTTSTNVASGTFAGVMFNQGANSSVVDNFSAGNLHPIAQLDTEQDWTQPQHFTQPVTIGATNPVVGALTTGLSASQINLYNGANVATMTWLAQNATGNPLLSTSSTPSLKFLDCQTTSTCAQASVSSPVFLIKGGPIALSGGTIAIGSLPYSSSTSYVCSVNDVTATNAVQVVYTSGTTVTFNGTTTDSIRYICWGI